MTSMRITARSLSSFLFVRRFNYFDGLMATVLMLAYHEGVPGLGIFCLVLIIIFISVALEDITKRILK